MVAELITILRRGSEHPTQLGPVIQEFLSVFDSVSDVTLEEGGSQWQTLDVLAYELRFYSPMEPRDHALIGDDEALKHIRTALRQLT